MPEVQKAIAEALRMWPAPPLLIRCAVEAQTWPEGGTGIPAGKQVPYPGATASSRRWIQLSQSARAGPPPAGMAAQ